MSTIKELMKLGRKIRFIQADWLATMNSGNDVDRGSAIPQILRIQDGPLFDNGADYFAEARDLLEQAIEAVDKGLTLPSKFSRHLLYHFNAFGRTLKGNEVLIVARAGARDGPARYDIQTRRKMMLINQATYEVEETVIGTVQKVDRPHLGFTVEADSGVLLSGVTSPIFLEPLSRALHSQQPVSIRGLIEYSALDVAERIIQVDDVSPAEDDSTMNVRGGCRIPVAQQFFGLLALPRGWHDPESPAYSENELKWAQSLIQELIGSFDLPTPFIYPNPEGLVNVEWPVGKWELSIELDIVNKIAEALAVKVDADESADSRLNLNDATAVLRLGSFLKPYFKR